MLHGHWRTTRKQDQKAMLSLFVCLLVCLFLRDRCDPRIANLLLYPSSQFSSPPSPTTNSFNLDSDSFYSNSRPSCDPLPSFPFPKFVCLFLFPSLQLTIQQKHHGSNRKCWKCVGSRCRILHPRTWVLGSTALPLF